MMLTLEQLSKDRVPYNKQYDQDGALRVSVTKGHWTGLFLKGLESRRCHTVSVVMYHVMMGVRGVQRPVVSPFSNETSYETSS